ncbi:MAG: hypothetical protein HYW89_01325 [Candidatus Sungiibacteriota bacterium]|uniref:Uncharacterized protein n=1 Tax=Candidatus Sungiibacteriota bacterium TaxID=2750080 RepID=A0A7T5UQV0_9BACT|nr:MAG: hypothetical protein HYW89_01325 [Candidatus Sungbacteria bacterium]
MGMTVEQINEWRLRRLKVDGRWTSGEDLLDCIFEAMSGVGPCNGQWNRQPTVKWSYIRLVEIACEYFREHIDINLLRKFLHYLLVPSLSGGITFLTPDQKCRFAGQLAWMLNLPGFVTTVATFLAPLGARMPDTDTVATDWLEARKEYKRRR